MITLDLNLIAAHLEGLEETIIHRLIDRAQFASNPDAYRPGHSGFRGAGGKSLFDLRLRYQEEMDAAFARYLVPEERPMHHDLPPPRREAQLPTTPLEIDDMDRVNVTPQIVRGYLEFLPRLCDVGPGDDGQHGSSVEHDVLAIQAIARRVHYGALYVAESKYRSAPDLYAPLLAAGNREEILRTITRPEVEERILRRVSQKVDYVQATINTAVRRKIDREVVLGLYRDLIIPLTKEGELRYLFNRRVTGSSDSRSGTP